MWDPIAKNVDVFEFIANNDGVYDRET